MSEAAEIAKKLTKAQQEAVLSLSEHPIMLSVHWSVSVGYGLEELGLAKRTLLTDRTHLTPLGLAVRDILKETPDA